MGQNQGFTIWFTGMLGAGKSSTANYISARLQQVARSVEVLDEDILATTFWPEMDAGSSEEWQAISDRLGWLAEVMGRNGICSLIASTSPYKSQREEIHRRIPRVLEVFLDSPVEALIKRDTTGKYKQALASEIPHFPGITSPYEPPNNPEVHVRTDAETLEEGGRKVFQALLDLGWVTPEELKIITGARGRASGNNKTSKVAPQAQARAEKAKTRAKAAVSKKPKAAKATPKKEIAPKKKVASKKKVAAKKKLVPKKKVAPKKRGVLPKKHQKKRK